MRKFFVMPLLASTLVLGACEGVQWNKQTLGSLVGAAGGGLLGSQVGSGTGRLMAVAAGTLGGAFLGSEVGKSLDRADRLYAEQTAQTALETAPVGQRVTWRNPETGHHGWTAPIRTYQRRGTSCREYQTTIVVGGKDVQGYGTACRQADGSWKIVNDDSSSVAPVYRTSPYAARPAYGEARPVPQVFHREPWPRVVYVRPNEGRERCRDSSYRSRSRYVSGRTLYKVFTGDVRRWERAHVFGSLIPSMRERSSTSCHRTYYR